MVSVDGNVYGNITSGYASLANELKLDGVNSWKQGTDFAPFDQEVMSILIITALINVNFNISDAYRIRCRCWWSIDFRYD